MQLNRYEVSLSKVVLTILVFVILAAAGQSFVKAENQAKSEQSDAQQDRHAGYYYPAPQTSETYPSAMPFMQGISKKSRIGFIVGVTELLSKRNFAPGFVMYAKGEEAEKLIIVSVDNNRFQTLFQLRALMAQLSAQVRTSPLFSNTGSPENLNFLDLCHIAGFTQVTLSNGRDISHQITLK